MYLDSVIQTIRLDDELYGWREEKTSTAMIKGGFDNRQQWDGDQKYEEKNPRFREEEREI